MQKEQVIDKQFTAVKALIVNKNGEILLLQESDVYEDGTSYSRIRWWLPWGRVNAGESRQDALKREVKEEAGLDIKEYKPFYVGEWYPKVRWEQRQILGVFFFCTMVTDDVELWVDHEKYLWIAPYDYVKYQILPPEDKAIQHYLDTL